MMFLPLGGVFVFGAGGILGAVIGFVNMLFGGLALWAGYAYGIMWLVIAGYVVLGMGVLGFIFGLLNKKQDENQSPR
jgi:hypothetical protein